MSLEQSLQLHAKELITKVNLTRAIKMTEIRKVTNVKEDEVKNKCCMCRQEESRQKFSGIIDAAHMETLSHQIPGVQFFIPRKFIPSNGEPKSNSLRLMLYFCGTCKIYTELVFALITEARLFSPDMLRVVKNEVGAQAVKDKQIDKVMPGKPSTPSVPNQTRIWRIR